MAGLSVTEKQHWRDRISARIGKRIEAIRAEHPALLERITRAAHQQALVSLGLADSYEELKAIHAEHEALEKRKRRAHRTMLVAIRGVPLEEVSDNFQVTYGTELQLPQEAASAISKRQSAHEQQLLSDDPVGREIPRWEQERERLLDTVWLACSPAQVKQLWTKVAELLGDAQTELEREALAIKPSEEG